METDTQQLPTRRDTEDVGSPHCPTEWGTVEKTEVTVPATLREVPKQADASHGFCPATEGALCKEWLRWDGWTHRRADRTRVQRMEGREEQMCWEERSGIETVTQVTSLHTHLLTGPSLVLDGWGLPPTVW